MRKVNHLISLIVFAGLGLSGCSIENEKKDEKSPAAGGTEEPVAEDKGRMSLKLPKQDKVAYKSLEITLESSNYDGCSWPEPYPMPEPAYEDDYDRQGGADSAALRSPKQETEIETWSDHCKPSKSYYYSQTFDYVEEGVVSIDDIVPGSYQIHVRLLSASGNAIEEGYGWADVAPGVVTQAYVEIYPTRGNGRLDVEIVRGGDRVDYKDDRGEEEEEEDGYEGCGPSAYVGGDGEVHHAKCSSASNDDPTPSAVPEK